MVERRTGCTVEHLGANRVPNARTPVQPDHPLGVSWSYESESTGSDMSLDYENDDDDDYVDFGAVANPMTDGLQDDAYQQEQDGGRNTPVPVEPAPASRTISNYEDVQGVGLGGWPHRPIQRRVAELRGEMPSRSRPALKDYLPAAGPPRVGETDRRTPTPRRDQQQQTERVPQLHHIQRIFPPGTTEQETASQGTPTPPPRPTQPARDAGAAGAGGIDVRGRGNPPDVVPRRPFVVPMASGSFRLGPIRRTSSLRRSLVYPETEFGRMARNAIISTKEGWTTPSVVAPYTLPKAKCIAWREHQRLQYQTPKEIDPNANMFETWADKELSTPWDARPLRGGVVLSIGADPDCPPANPPVSVTLTVPGTDGRMSSLPQHMLCGESQENGQRQFGVWAMYEPSYGVIAGDAVGQRLHLAPIAGYHQVLMMGGDAHLTAPLRDCATTYGQEAVPLSVAHVHKKCRYYRASGEMFDFPPGDYFHLRHATAKSIIGLDERSDDPWAWVIELHEKEKNAIVMVAIAATTLASTPSDTMLAAHAYGMTTQQNIVTPAALYGSFNERGPTENMATRAVMPVELMQRLVACAERTAGDMLIFSGVLDTTKPSDAPAEITLLDDETFSAPTLTTLQTVADLRRRPGDDLDRVAQIITEKCRRIGARLPHQFSPGQPPHGYSRDTHASR